MVNSYKEISHMKEITKRQYLIIKTLNEKNRPMTSNELCSLLNISPRTLRYDINAINTLTNENTIESGKQGYQLKNTKTLSSYVQLCKNDEDLKKNIILCLLQHQKMNIYDLEQTCYISSSKIIAELPFINSIIREHHVSILKKEDTLFVHGEEKDKRRLLSHFFFSEANSLANDIYHFENFFDHFTLTEIQDIIITSLNENNIDLDTVYLKNLTLVCAIFLQRILDGFPIDIEAIEEYELENSKEYSFIKSFIDHVNQKYNILISNKDFSYLQSLITGFFHFDNEEKLDDDFNKKIKFILDKTLNYYQLDFDYQPFFHNFVLHIHNLILRSKTGTFFKTDFAKSLQESHPFIYDIAVYIAYQLNVSFDVEISKDEISLIAIYFGTVLNDQVTYNKTKVVCVIPQYNILRSVFISTLNNHFIDRMEIVEVVSSYSEINKDLKYDFIITTLKNEVIMENTVYASPIITPHELHKIEQKLLYFLNQEKQFALKQKLLKYLDKDLFIYTKNANKNGYEVLKEIHSILEDKQIINEDYFNNVLQREKMASTVFFNRLAIPHALNIEANETKIFYYYTEEPINWFHNEKVNLILFITSSGYHKEFVDIYNMLLDILMDNETYLSLTKSKSFDELIDYIINPI